MKGFVRLISATLAVVALSISCSKDKPTGSLAFDQPAVYMQAGESVTVHFTPSANVSSGSYSFTSLPKGWDDPVVDAAKSTITVTAPKTFDAETVKTGNVVMSGAVSGGNSVAAALFVGVVSATDLSGESANSYLVTKPLTNYTFDVMHKGDGTSALATASVNVIWQSMSGLLQYVQFENGKVSFYVGADDKDKLKEGNALIGAYDASGTLLWSWHIWVADYDPAKDALVLGAYTLMDRNLGALKNSNASEADILASYGLYYQWGRKDPFIGPSTYDAASGKSATMYNGDGGRVTLKTALSTADTGTQGYATQNPLTYITTEKPGDDWFFPSVASYVPVRWADTKTENDPCPAGWRVAPAAAFAGLTVSGTPVDKDAMKYGWTLTNGVAQGFFLGAGRRVYANGSIQNIYIPKTKADFAQPWVGLYWTTTTQETQSKALYFWYEKSTITSGIDVAADYGRANAMQVRCVKMAE